MRLGPVNTCRGAAKWTAHACALVKVENIVSVLWTTNGVE